MTSLSVPYVLTYVFYSRVQSALTTRKVTNSMAGVVKAMDAAMKSMNLEKISGLMDRFEQQFEDLGNLTILKILAIKTHSTIIYFRCSKQRYGKHHVFNRHYKCASIGCRFTHDESR